MNWTVWIAAQCAALVAIAAALIGLIDGPHRMVCPECFGLTEIADRLYTDAPPQRHSTLRRLARTADKETARFFGPLQSRPVTVLCATSACIKRFSRGASPIGVTFSWLAIRISPRGLRQTTLTHERVHAELHARLGLAGWFRGGVPMWFDEGLAVVLSDDQKLIARGRKVEWIDEAESWSDWKRIVRAYGNRRTYAAAARRVADYERRLGRVGLRRIIARVERGEDFETVLYDELVGAGRKGNSAGRSS